MPIAQHLQTRERRRRQNARDDRFTRRVFAVFIVFWLLVCALALSLVFGFFD